MAENPQQRLSENLARVRSEIALAASRAGRLPEQVRLVAVTKTADLERILRLITLGQRDLAENRVQALAERVPSVARTVGQPRVNWHMIGTLQRNKVRTLLPLIQMIHSVDSRKLAEEVSRRAVALASEPSPSRSEWGRGPAEPVRILLEVNVSGETSKQGLSPGEVGAVLDSVVGLPMIQVCGLMTMAPFESDPEATRPVFAGLRTLAERLRERMSPEHAAHFTELSMGMSNDYRVAVEEGATLVRIGSALFEGT